MFDDDDNTVTLVEDAALLDVCNEIHVDEMYVILCFVEKTVTDNPGFFGNDGPVVF